MLKKINKAVLLFIILIPFVLSSCKANHSESEQSSFVLTSFYPIYLITSFIADGSGLEIRNMAQPQTGCLHDYQLSTTDVRLMSQASVFVINGSGMENSFMEQASQNTGVKIIDSSEGLNSELPEGHSHNDGHDHGSANSHIWTSLEMVQTQAKNICSGLSEIYPDYADIFSHNADNFISRAESLAKTEDNSKHFNAISFNEAFEYMLEDNGAHIEYTIEIDENISPTAKEMAEISDRAKEAGISAIFCADDSSLNFANAISREINSPVYILDPLTYGVSSNDYFDAMEKNISIIKEAAEND